ncbi:HAD-IA family hydrolase, partial [Enterococcus cecorum]
SQRLGNSLDIVADLADKADLYVVTNGVAKTQYQRLEAAKLLPYFKDIFVSETIGYQKPRIEFFQHVFNKIAPVDLEKTV